MFCDSAGVATNRGAEVDRQRTASLLHWIEGFAGLRAEARALLRENLVAMADSRRDVANCVESVRIVVVESMHWSTKTSRRDCR